MGLFLYEAVLPNTKPDTPTPKKIVLATFGSLGDLYPYLSIARELKRRGHRPIVASAERHRNSVEKANLEFAPMRPDWPAADEMERAFAPVMDARGGTKYLFEKLILPQLRESYEDLLLLCRDADLLISHSLVPAAPLVAQTTGITWVSCVLSPIFLASRRDPPRMPIVPQIGDWPLIGKVWSRALLSLVQKRLLPTTQPIADLRAELGLASGAHPIFAGQHSPQRVLALFSPHFAAPQSDWPRQTRTTGFCFYDGAGELSDEVQSFLEDGAPPVVFTLGASSIHDSRDFFEQSLEAIKSTSLRALFIVGNKFASLPNAPSNVAFVPYSPLSQLLPRAAALVQHGGAGTGALAWRAATPMLIVPQANDQPDNAVRFARTGTARVLWRHQYRAPRVAQELQLLLGAVHYSHRAEVMRTRIEKEGGAKTACDEIEKILNEAR